MFNLLSIIDYKLYPVLPDRLVIGLYSESDTADNLHVDPDFRKSKFLITNLIQDSGVELSDYELHKLPGGKPYLQQASTYIGVSISHTKRLFLVGINRIGEIGIDIESIDRKTHHNLTERIKNQYDSYLTPIASLQVWTIKEAVLKLTGSGLRTNMNKLAIQQKSTILFHVFHENLDISIVSFKHSGCWISIAWTEH